MEISLIFMWCYIFKVPLLLIKKIYSDANINHFLYIKRFGSLVTTIEAIQDTVRETTESIKFVISHFTRTFAAISSSLLQLFIHCKKYET